MNTRPPASYSPQELAQRLGANIYNARCGQGLTQEHVAERIGLAIEKYVCMEQGTYLPSIEMFTSLFYALGVPLEELLDPQEPRFQLIPGSRTH